MYQVGALQAYVRAAGARLEHVKPHGALYHMAARDDGLAEAIVRAVRSLDRRLLLYGPPNSRLQDAAQRQGVGFVAEGFADRTYLADGSLAARGMRGAVIERPEQSLAQALCLAKDGKVRTVAGEIVDMPVRTICLHGDTPQAAERAKMLADGLRSEGVQI